MSLSQYQINVPATAWLQPRELHAPRAARSPWRPAVALMFGIASLIQQPAALGQLLGGHSFKSTPRPATIERPAEMEYLLKQAGEGIARADWKLAIDSLQRILDDPNGGVLPVDDGIDPEAGRFVYYRSTRDQALQMLASLPPEGLEAYRVLHDGRAEALLEQAIDTADAGLLRTITDQYLLTSAGDDAAALLAAWQLDRSNPIAALDLIAKIDTYCHQSDVAAWRKAVTTAAALHMLGERDTALLVLEQVDEATLPPRAREAMSAIRRHIRSVPPVTRHDWLVESQEAWPILGGDGMRQNRMPSVTPELREDLPWRFSIPSDNPDWWVTAGLEQRRQRPTLPVSQAVVQDGRIFVRGLRQVVALDLESTDPLWISDPPSATISRRRSSHAMSDGDRLLFDHVGGSLAAGFSKVFVIEHEGAGVPFNSDALHPILSLIRHGFDGDRMLALDATDGSLVWQRGRSGDPADELGDVMLLGPPLPVRGELWVPLIKNTDLQLAVLSPVDGRLLHSVVVCTVDTADLSEPRRDAVYPASDGQTVFLSTGEGLFVAIDIDSRQVRWAVQYQRDRSAVMGETFAPSEWHCSAPVVSGRTVVVAPPDSSGLLAMDRTTGELLWTQPRPSGAFYILGGDESRVWLGGTRLYCFVLTDGRLLWGPSPSEAMDVTGRAAISGDTILVPQFDAAHALVAYDADDGKRLQSYSRPADQPALGNLLCIASSLISIDPNELRKYPDLSQSYPKQLARFKEHPGDARCAVRLAWLEMLREDFDAAYRVLQGVDTALPNLERRRDDVTRLRVDALLGMAGKPDVSADDAISYLRQAAELAGEGIHRLRATLALAMRLRDVGRSSEGYDLLWQCALTGAADSYLTIAPKLRTQARVAIGEVLGKLERDLSPGQRRSIADQAAERVDEAVAQLDDPETRSAAIARLNSIAELNDAGGGGQAALIALARWEGDRGQVEDAGQLLRRAIRMNRVARSTCQALYDLAVMSLSPDLRLDFQASSLLDRLEREYTGQTVSVRSDGSIHEESIADAVGRLRRQVDARRAKQVALLRSPERFRFTAERATRTGLPPRPGPLLLTYGNPPNDASARTMLFFSTPNIVRAYDVDNGNMQWETHLRLLQQGLDQFANILGTGNTDAYPRVICDGQTAVINGPSGVYGVGLISGRRLWAIQYDDQETNDSYALRNRLLAVNEGVVVCAPRRGVLTAARLGDGDDVLWERVLSGVKLDSVFVTDDFCFTLDTSRRKVSAYWLANGRSIGRFQFNRPAELDEIPIVYVDGYLIGPDGTDAAVCYNLLTGDVAWRYETQDQLAWLFKPGGGLVGFYSSNGDVALVDAYDGTQRLNATLSQPPAAYASGVLRDDALILMPIYKENGSDDPSLISLDVDSGRIKWRHDRFGYTGLGREVLWRLLDAADDVIPMFFNNAAPNDDEPGEIALETIDKATGRVAGPVIMTGHMASESERLTGDLGFWPGQLVFATKSGLLSAPLLGEPSDDSGGGP